MKHHEGAQFNERSIPRRKGRSVRCQVSTHQVHEIQREYVDTAGDGGQRADDGGQNAETTRTEQKILQRKPTLAKPEKCENTQFFSPPTFS